jgi:hypothetical protein
MRIRTWSALLAIGAIGSMLGCSTRIIDAGSGDSGASSGESAATTSSELGPGLVEASMSPGLSAIYEGDLSSGGHGGVATLTFQLPTPTTLTGTVLLEGTPLAPPTDPDVGYPINGRAYTPGTFVEGFPYTVRWGTFDGKHAHFEIDESEIFEKWCELQTTTYPIYGAWSDPLNGLGGDEIVGYGCLPNDGFTWSPTDGCSLLPTDAGPIPVDCGKLQLCLKGTPVCSCTATACAVDLANAVVDIFDLDVHPGLLVGTVKGITGLEGLSFGARVYGP